LDSGGIVLSSINPDGSDETKRGEMTVLHDGMDDRRSSLDLAYNDSVARRI
jgi:hypothetical protein